MTITTTTLGDHTTQVSLNGETSIGPMILALDAAIVSGAYWIQHDVTNQYYRVYKSLNIDGISYKYAAVSIDPWKQKMWIFTMENWDAINHVATNEAYSTYGGYWSGFTLSNCDIVVFSGQKWLGIQTYVRSINNVSNSFVVETSREHVQDTPALGYPCWGYLQPTSTAQPAPYGSGVSAYMFAMPRTRNGYVGRNAALYSWMSTPYARISGNNAAIASTGMPSNGIASALNSYNNAWDSTNNYSYTLKVGVSSSCYQGRLTAIKGTRVPGATLLNRVTVPVDSDFFYSSTGTPTEHWTIPINQERLNSVASTAITTPTYVYDAVWNGDRVYCTSNGSSFKIDLTTNTATSIGGGGNYRSICFDGRYIWALNGSNIIRWDTTNDTLVTGSTITGMSAQRMCYDGTFLWTVDANVTSQTIIVRKIDPTTLLQVSQYATPAISTTIRGSDIACDVFGNIAFTVNDTNTILNNRVYRLSNGVITGYLAVPGITTTSWQYSSMISWMGGKGFDVFSIYNGSTQLIQFLHVDCSVTTPVNLMYDALANAPTNIPVGYSYSYYTTINRQGRGVFYNDNGVVLQQDFESQNTNDSRAITPASLAITGGYNVGTHMINWINGYTLYISPLPPAVATTSAVYLLPK